MYTASERRRLYFDEATNRRLLLQLGLEQLTTPDGASDSPLIGVLEWSFAPHYNHLEKPPNIVVLGPPVRMSLQQPKVRLQHDGARWYYHLPPFGLPLYVRRGKPRPQPYFLRAINLFLASEAQRQRYFPETQT